jgi:hypothetical protein
VSLMFAGSMQRLAGLFFKSLLRTYFFQDDVPRPFLITVCGLQNRVRVRWYMQFKLLECGGAENTGNRVFVHALRVCGNVHPCSGLTIRELLMRIFLYRGEPKDNRVELTEQVRADRDAHRTTMPREPGQFPR